MLLKVKMRSCTTRLDGDEGRTVNKKKHHPDEQRNLGRDRYFVTMFECSHVHFSHSFFFLPLIGLATSLLWVSLSLSLCILLLFSPIVPYSIGPNLASFSPLSSSSNFIRGSALYIPSIFMPSFWSFMVSRCPIAHLLYSRSLSLPTYPLPPL